jgi:hypothetical protein
LQRWSLIAPDLATRNEGLAEGLQLTLRSRFPRSDNSEIRALGYRSLISRINKLLRRRTCFMRY